MKVASPPDTNDIDDIFSCCDTLARCDVFRLQARAQCSIKARRDSPTKERLHVKTYRAHYTSPATVDPVNGTFEFESASKAGSRQNATDARIKMLEVFGNNAVSWVIDSVERVEGVDEAAEYVQPQLDFREPKKARKHHTFQRGRV